MNRRLAAATLGVLSFSVVAAACGDDEISRDEAIKTMTEGDVMTEEQAGCVWDDLGDDAGKFLGQDNDDASDEDVQRLTESMSKCMGLEIPNMSMPEMPTISVPAMPTTTTA